MYSRLGLLSAVLCAGLSALPSSALAQAERSTAAAPTTTVTIVEGKLIIAITADNKSAIPVTTTLWCNARTYLSSGEAATYDYRLYFAKAEVTVSQVSCAIEVPYHVSVSDPATAVMDVRSEISSAPLANVGFIPFLPIASAAPKTNLYVSLPSLSFPLPPAGATTLKSVHDFI
jgi:hypothetical protein